MHVKRSLWSIDGASVLRGMFDSYDCQFRTSIAKSLSASSMMHLAFMKVQASNSDDLLPSFINVCVCDGL